MDFNTASSRVESFVSDLRSDDWQQRIGGWTLTLVSVTVVWWFLSRVRYTAKAVLGQREMPVVVPDVVSTMFFPIDLGIVAVFAFWGYLCALAVWWVVGRRYRVDSLSRRLASLFTAGSIGLAGLLFVAGTAIQIAEGNPPADVVIDGVEDILEWLREWLVYLPIPVVATSLVASWRRGEFEVTTHRRQALAVAAVAIVVAPGVLGAAGMGAATADSPEQYTPETEVSIVEQMDDGEPGPFEEDLAESNLTRGEFQPATAVLGCGDANRSSFAVDAYFVPDYAASEEINISEPQDTGETYIELAVYQNDSSAVHGRYAYRLDRDGWRVLETWYGNAAGGQAGNPTGEGIGAYHVNGEPNSGILAMEKIDALTIGFDLVNPEGEIVRVRYRLCPPTSES